MTCRDTAYLKFNNRNHTLKDIMKACKSKFNCLHRHISKKPKFDYKTRTKTSIRYGKENDREKRKRRRERERKVEGEIKRGRER